MSDEIIEENKKTKRKKGSGSVIDQDVTDITEDTAPDTRELDIYKKLAKFKPKPQKEIETGIFSLDLVLVKLYTGDVIEVSSPSGVGKSTLMMQISKNIVTGKYSVVGEKKKFPKVCYIDVEGGINEQTVELYGLKKYLGNQFQLVTVTTYSELEEVLEDVLKSNEPFDAVIIDSITDVNPDVIFEKSVTDLQIGLEARLQTILLKKFKPLFRQVGTNLWLVNQMRIKSKKVGYQMIMEEASAGAKTLEFSPDVRLRLAKGGDITEIKTTIAGEAKTTVGTDSEIWSLKNRKGFIKIKVPMPILYGKGIMNYLLIKNILSKKDILKVTGKISVLDFKDGTEPVRLTKGVKELRDYLIENLTAIKDKLQDLGHWSLLTLQAEQKNQDDLDFD